MLLWFVSLVCVAAASVFVPTIKAEFSLCVSLIYVSAYSLLFCSTVVSTAFGRLMMCFCAIPITLELKISLFATPANVSRCFVPVLPASFLFPPCRFHNADVTML